jgi:hypothetical protein
VCESRLGLQETRRNLGERSRTGRPTAAKPGWLTCRLQELGCKLWRLRTYEATPAAATSTCMKCLQGALAITNVITTCTTNKSGRRIRRCFWTHLEYRQYNTYCVVEVRSTYCVWSAVPSTLPEYTPALCNQLPQFESRR